MESVPLVDDLTIEFPYVSMAMAQITRGYLGSMCRRHGHEQHLWSPGPRLTPWANVSCF